MLLLATVMVVAAAIDNPVDKSSYSNVHEIRTRHQHLDIKVDFAKRQFVGKITHDMEILEAGVTYAFFDYTGIDVSKVSVRTDGAFVSAQYQTSTPRPAIGSALQVTIPAEMRSAKNVQVAIEYSTNKGQTATSWMTKEQTACKTMEYLYTQCEDIACRSIAPMQDTPQNRITYSANVTVAKQFDVRMSANRTAVTDSSATERTFSYVNNIPMASYLIALAVGDLVYRPLDQRTGVITEPCRIDAVAWELSELPMFLNYAEDYLTPYIWGNYSIIILPPSFPMGGMENPLLTFASPTIITGDKSQVDVAIHEIAHSWTGNQVTCENWSNMWMNEGFTVFEERKVSARIHGVNFSKVNAFVGNISATSDMLGFGMSNNYSSLYPLLDGNQFPDGSFSTIPYEKGFQLLWYLESLIGETLMNKLVRQHIYKNSLTSLNYTVFQKEFEALVRKEFVLPERILSKMDWDAWVKQPGLAPVKQDFTTPELNASHELAD